jgi:hypothetical protein
VLFRLREEALHVCFRAHVGLHRDGRATGVLDGRDDLSGRGGMGLIVDGDAMARPGQS